MIDSIPTLTPEQFPDLYRYIAEHPHLIDQCAEEVHRHHPHMLKSTVRACIQQTISEAKREAREAKRLEDKQAKEAERASREQRQQATQQATQQALYAGLPPVLVAYFEAYKDKRCSVEDLTQFISACASDTGAEALRQQGHDVQKLDLVGLEACAQVYAKLTSTPLMSVRARLKLLVKQEAQASAKRALEERRAKEPDWMNKLTRKENGEPSSSIANAMLYMLNHEGIAGTLAHNEFTGATLWLTQPKLIDDFADSREIKPMSAVTDDEATLVQLWLQQHGQHHEHPTVQRLIDAAAKTKCFHPVRDYLNSIDWDGTERVHNFLHRYLGAPDDAYTRLVSRIWLVGAVARVMRPGCKMDTMPILEGPQGIGKSTAIRRLHGDTFSTDQLSDLGTKDAQQEIRGLWVVELAELDKLLKAMTSTAKRFLSSLADRYRPSYGRRIVEVLRQMLFVGSVNPENDGTYLRDTTGNRRYLPVMTSTIDLEAIDQDRDQLWAEAYALFLADAKWWPANAEEVALCKAEQDKRLTRDAWTDKVMSFVAVARLATVTTSYILETALDVEIKDQTNYLAGRVGSTLRLAGWTPEEVQHPTDGHIRYFKHPDAVIPEDLKLSRATINTWKLPETAGKAAKPESNGRPNSVLDDLQ